MPGKNRIRAIVFYKDYFRRFFDCLNTSAQYKIIWTLELLEELPRVPETYLKHIENTRGLYEIRVQSGSDIFRIFCFFDRGNIVVVTSGFQKKDQKTPKREIDKALRIRFEYEKEKKQHPDT